MFAPVEGLEQAFELFKALGENFKLSSSDSYLHEAIQFSRAFYQLEPLDGFMSSFRSNSKLGLRYEMTKANKEACIAIISTANDTSSFHDLLPHFYSLTPAIRPEYQSGLEMMLTKLLSLQDPSEEELQEYKHIRSPSAYESMLNAPLGTLVTRVIFFCLIRSLSLSRSLFLFISFFY